VSIWRKTEQRALPVSIDPERLTARSVLANYSGEFVDEVSAFASSAVLAAVSMIADSVAAMDVELVREEHSRLIRIDKPDILETPNDNQTMFEFIHQAVTLIATMGADYIYAPRGNNGVPIEMRNLSAKVVTPTLVDGTQKFKIGENVYDSSLVRQVPWLTFPDRLRPISPLEAQRNTIGMGIAMDRFLSQFYGEGATPSSILETDQQLSKEAAEVLRDTWEDSHYKRRRPAVLANGLKWKPITTSAADMQMLEHREAIVRDIARTFRIPADMILAVSGSSNQTYKNVEQAGINFVRYTLLPYMRRLEDALSSFFPSGQRVRFNADEFQRADLMTRVRAEQLQIMSGTLTPNEARAMENREPYDGGDQFVLGLQGAVVAGVEGGKLPTLGIDEETEQ
jgi:HK97 family phage portal protein